MLRYFGIMIQLPSANRGAIVAGGGGGARGPSPAKGSDGLAGGDARRICVRTQMHRRKVPVPPAHLIEFKYASKSAIAGTSICFSRPSGMNDNPVLRSSSM